MTSYLPTMIVSLGILSEVTNNSELGVTSRFGDIGTSRFCKYIPTVLLVVVNRKYKSEIRITSSL